MFPVIRNWRIHYQNNAGKRMCHVSKVNFAIKHFFLISMLCISENKAQSQHSPHDNLYFSKSHSVNFPALYMPMNLNAASHSHHYKLYLCCMHVYNLCRAMIESTLHQALEDHFISELMPVPCTRQHTHTHTQSDSIVV